MNMKRKTIRFQDNASDLYIYEAICDYKSLGFRSESHMVIEAVRQMLSKKASDLTPEELADLIAKRLSSSLVVSSNATDLPKEEPPSEEAAFDAALNFLDNF